MSGKPFLVRESFPCREICYQQGKAFLKGKWFPFMEMCFLHAVFQTKELMKNSLNSSLKRPTWETCPGLNIHKQAYMRSA